MYCTIYIYTASCISGFVILVKFIYLQGLKVNVLECFNFLSVMN